MRKSISVPINKHPPSSYLFSRAVLESVLWTKTVCSVWRSRVAQSKPRTAVLAAKISRSVKSMNFLLVRVNSLHPNISMHILHTVLYTFLWCRQGEFSFDFGISMIWFKISLHFWGSTGWDNRAYSHVVPIIILTNEIVFCRIVQQKWEKGAHLRTMMTVRSASATKRTLARMCLYPSRRRKVQWWSR